MDTIKIGSLEVARFILGGNPFSGFSHHSAETDRRMRHYFSAGQVKRLLRDAEALGVNTVLGRCDRHLTRLLLEYWDEGGGIQWIAQTCPELDTMERSVQSAVEGGAKACYIHGGVMDHLMAQGKLSEVPPAIEMIRAAGLPAGIAGHTPKVHQWAENELDVDFYMCSYYNPFPRDERPDAAGQPKETYDDQDRQRMVETIATLSHPAIHYKILAAGRKDPKQAFAFAAKHLRPGDAVCVGIYDEDKPDMLRHDVALFEQSLIEGGRDAYVDV